MAWPLSEPGVPVVRVHPGLVLDHLWEGLVASTLSGVRVDLGLDADPTAERLVAAPQISYFPSEFDPGPDAAAITRVRRPGLPRPVEDREPLVYVTFGSEIPGMPMFVPAVTAAVAAARQTGCRVLLSVGPADPSVLDDLSGVEVASWVDQAAVLPRARAVISHAGAGTTLDALAAGTPTVAVPFFADQPRNAEQLEATRTGLAVPPGPRLTERLTDALQRSWPTSRPGARGWPGRCTTCRTSPRPSLSSSGRRAARSPDPGPAHRRRLRRVASTWFLAVAGVTGDSTVDGHENELEVSGWTWGLSSRSPQPAGAAVAGRPVLADLVVTLASDFGALQLVGSAPPGATAKRSASPEVGGAAVHLPALRHAAGQGHVGGAGGR